MVFVSFSSGLSIRAGADLRIGLGMSGPRFGTTSNSMPMAGSGVRISLNMMTPSGRNARQGCSDSSVAISAFSERSRNGNRSEYLRQPERSVSANLLDHPFLLRVAG